MRRLLFHFSALFLSTLSLDSEFNEPTYKFGILAGEPTSLNGSSAVQVSSFDECVEKCSEDFECILASQNASTAPCNLFKWNTVTGVRRNESGGEGFVAFRLFTDQPACELNLPLLLNGKTYQLYPNDTDQYLWRVDTSEDGYNITYIRNRDDLNQICGNWSYNRPYADGCNPECLITMVQIYAQPGPLSNYQKYQDPRQIAAQNWDDCLNGCWKQRQCIAAWWQEDKLNCTWYSPADELYLIKRMSASDGHQMVLKLSLNNETCKYTTEQLLNDTYFMADGKHIQSFWNQERYDIPPTVTYMPFWRIRTTKEYIVMNFYEKETTEVRGGSGCPVEFYPSSPYTRFTGDSSYKYNYTFCYRPFYAPHTTGTEAKKLCGLIGGYLMPPQFFDMFGLPRTGGLIMSDIKMSNFLPYQWGFPSVSINPSEIKIWAGIEPEPMCVNEKSTSKFCNSNQRWRLTDPSIPVLYQPLPQYPNMPPARKYIDFNWASGDGHPIISPTKNCVYYRVWPTNSPNRTFLLYTSECDRTDVDGFICAMWPQQHNGIPAYMDMAAKYGFTEPRYEVNPSVFDSEL